MVHFKGRRHSQCNFIIGQNVKHQETEHQNLAIYLYYFMVLSFLVVDILVHEKNEVYCLLVAESPLIIFIIKKFRRAFPLLALLEKSGK